MFCMHEMKNTQQYSNLYRNFFIGCNLLLRGFQSLYEFLFKIAFEHSSELSVYVAEEMKILQEEIVSLDKVTMKLELEMRQAMGIKG